MAPVALDPRFDHAAQVGSRQRTLPVRLFNQVAVLDTASRFPSTLLQIRVVRGRTTFTVNNTCNQTVTVTLIGDLTNNPLAPDIGGATTIAASSQGTISTDVYAPYLGVRISFGTAPTSGTVTVDGATESGQ